MPRETPIRSTAAEHRGDVSLIPSSSSSLQTRPFVQTCVIAPVVWWARGAPSLPFPHRREGAERRKALVNTWRLRRRVPCEARSPSGAPLAASLDLGTVLPGPDGHSHATLSRQVSPPFIRTRPANEGGPRSRADGDPRRPGPMCAKHGRRRHTLLRQPDATGRRPQLSKAGGP